jgi:hypothetical protein
MKRIFLLSLVLLTALITWNCKKHNTNNALCTTCSEAKISHMADAADSTTYFVPNAFTPDGDGRNEVYYLTYANLVVDSSTLTIWDMTGKELYSKTINNKWDAKDMSGNRVGAGNYPVHVKLKTVGGTTLEFCTCVTILQYTGNCIKTNGITYYFPDQVDPTNGFAWPTTETLCP